MLLNLSLMTLISCSLSFLPPSPCWATQTHTLCLSAAHRWTTEGSGSPPGGGASPSSVKQKTVWKQCWETALQPARTLVCVCVCVWITHWDRLKSKNVNVWRGISLKLQASKNGHFAWVQSFRKIWLFLWLCSLIPWEAAAMQKVWKMRTTGNPPTGAHKHDEKGLPGVRVEIWCSRGQDILTYSPLGTSSKTTVSYASHNATCFSSFISVSIPYSYFWAAFQFSH